MRGDIYQAVYKSDNKQAKQMVQNPLTEALQSYKKALQLDEKDKYSKNIKVNSLS